MIKLQDFARECGVTDRAIQKHLKTYAGELEGLYQRKGPNGTWLTDEACEILRSKMKQLPPAVIDGETVRENDELKMRIRELEARLSEKEKLVEMAQRRADALQEKVSQVYALEEGKRAAEREVKLLEGFVADAKEEIQTLTEEKAVEVAEARKEAADAAEALEQMRTEAAQRLREAKEAEKREMAAVEAQKAAEAALEAYKALPWYKKLKRGKSYETHR